MTDQLAPAPPLVESVQHDAPPGDTTRRRFIGYLLATPMLAVAVRLELDDADRAAALPEPSDLIDLGDLIIAAEAAYQYNLRLDVTADNRVRFELPRLEKGQGVATALTLIVADEIDARLADTDVVLSDARLDRPFTITGSSNNVRAMWGPARVVAAAARARLVTAASRRWNVPAHTLVTRDTMVVAPDGRSATYGELSAEAAAVLIPAVPSTTKPASQRRLIGTPTGRVDARDIVTGKAQYALDVDVPGAVPTVVARPPDIKGTVITYDDTVARAMSGVVAVTRIPSGIAVSARTYDEALKARDALQIHWARGPLAGVSDATIRQRLKQINLPLTVPGILVGKVDATFEFPYVAHAPLEVQSAVADVRADRAEVWIASQTPVFALQEVAAAVGLPQHAVTLHVTRAGGSFGRRLFCEPAVEAALVSKAIGRPVKLMWTRVDDMRHGRFRPMSQHSLRATFLLGNVLSFEHRVAAAETDFRHGFGEMLTAAGAELYNGGYGQTAFHTTTKVPYDFPVVDQLLVEQDFGVPTGSWRAIYSGFTATANEIMVDELARRLGKDPVLFRRQRLETARTRAVLDRVATAGSWGRPMTPGTAQGVAIHEEYRSSVAYLVEIDTRGVEPRATKVVVAVDVGVPINPKGLEAQLQGAFIDAWSTMFRAQAHIDDGRVRESSFSDFRWARMQHSPPVMEVHVLPPTTDEPGGAGELGIPAASAAAVNAYARATGTSPRRFPIGQ
ncbi:MAG TPA: molybdopterin cofactor-binding domain-containing protein [Ilumatobacteraceae bacterium]|nr:molybdopterin cofactor-binding domain-containing protein [Ilumatobacteraceae bacterium]